MNTIRKRFDGDEPASGMRATFGKSPRMCGGAFPSRSKITQCTNEKTVGVIDDNSTVQVL
jgi:hypothetical protein